MRISSVRPISLCAFLLLTVVLGLFCMQPAGSDAPQQVVTRPLFFGRSLATPLQREQILKDADLSLSMFDSDLETTYNSIDPEKSLFIHNPATCCKDQSYQLMNWLNIALRQADPPTDYKNWLPSFQRGFGEASAPDLSTLQLWSVANRLDMSPPELHLVYGPNNPSDTVRAILEFVLPSDLTEMKSEARQWIQLSDPKATPDFAKCLLKLLTSLQAKVVSARLRTNSTVTGGGGLWYMTEWDFAKGKNALQPSALTDQIQMACLNSTTSGQPDGCKNVTAVWNAFPPDPLQGSLPESYPLAYSSKYPEILSQPDYNTAAAALGSLIIPSGLAHPTTAARDVLATQQCFFCHGVETNTAFTHMLNHDGSLAQDVSCFLAGKAGVARPTFAQLSRLNDPATCSVTVHFLAPEKISCSSDSVTPACSAGPLTETRNFHELARRAMHMSTLMLENRDRLPIERFQSFHTKSLTGYGTQMVH